MSTERDEHDGQGGSYVVDKNGRRKLVERTREPEFEREAKQPRKTAAADKE